MLACIFVQIATFLANFFLCLRPASLGSQSKNGVEMKEQDIYGLLRKNQTGKIYRREAVRTSIFCIFG